MSWSRKFPVLSVLVVASMTLASAADAQFTEGGRYAGFHLGMSGVGSTASVGVQGQIAINERISVGGWIDTWSYGQSYTFLGSSTEWNTRYFAIAGTGSYHFPIANKPKLDPFVGLSLGYYVVNATTSASSGTFTGSGSRVFLGGQAGGRYFFRENMSALALVGFGASYLTLGMDFGL